jgi:competence ComEA-like helix-hairpin-helix protein
MNKFRILFLAPALTLPLVAQSSLPDGPGKAATVRACTTCHGAEMFSGIRKGKAEWEHTVANMTTERGVEISDADFATVLKYLATNLGPAGAKININTAAAGQIADALGIDAKGAAAIVQYREKNGAFKDFDALKKVEGLDATALDAKKDRIEF